MTGIAHGLGSSHTADAAHANQKLPAVHRASMGDASDDDQPFGVVDDVDDAVVTDADAEVVAPGQSYDPARSRLGRKGVDRRGYARAQRVLEASVSPNRVRMQAYLVRLIERSPYVRTSDQGTAASRSSRAWRAARLSSR